MKSAGAADATGGDAERGDLAGALHDVSNALTVVLGWLDAARDRLPEGAGRNAVEVARVHARLGHALARRAIGAPVAAEQLQQAAAALARDAALAVRQDATRRGVKVVVSESGPELLLDDAPSVLQILLNLLLNAVAFSPAGGTVTLRLATDDGTAIFVVQDEGPGVEPERARTLFDGVPSSREGGAGIGLRHCKAIAERAGGDVVHVPSAKGARFELVWPAAPARSSDRPAPRALDSLEGKRFLVVEDDRAVLALVEVALAGRGAKVWAVTSLQELTAVTASGERFDAALVDLSPIETDPVRALAELRSANPELLVVMISGTAVGVPAGAERQVDRWVRKPFEIDEVIHALGVPG